MLNSEGTEGDFSFSLTQISTNKNGDLNSGPVSLPGTIYRKLIEPNPTNQAIGNRLNRLRRKPQN